MRHLAYTHPFDSAPDLMQFTIRLPNFKGLPGGTLTDVKGIVFHEKASGLKAADIDFTVNGQNPEFKSHKLVVDAGDKIFVGTTDQISFRIDNFCSIEDKIAGP